MLTPTADRLRDSGDAQTPLRPSTEWWRPEAELAYEGAQLPRATARSGSDSSGPFVALLVFTFILVLSPQATRPWLAALRPAWLAAFAAVVLLISELLRKGKPLLLPSSETWAAIGLVGWALATIPFSYWAGGSFATLTGPFGKALIILWLLGLTVNTPQRLSRAAWALTLMAIPLAKAGVYNYMTGNFIRSLTSERIVGYEGALASNPNDLALMLNLIIPLTIALLTIQRRFSIRLFLCGVVALSTVAIIFTHSRGGFVIMAALFLFYAWKLIRRRRPGWLAVLLIVVFLAVPLLPSGYLSRMNTITNIDEDETGSAQQRWELMKAATRYIVEHPLVGAGLGMDALALNDMLGPIWHDVHNVYLQIGMDLGIPGLVLYLVIVTSAFRSTIVVCRRCAGSADLNLLFNLSEGLQGSLCAFIVGAFFAPVAYNLYFYFIAGMAIGARETLAAESFHPDNL